MIWRVGLVSSGQLLPAVAFLQRHPETLYHIGALSAAATVGAVLSDNPPDLEETSPIITAAIRLLHALFMG